MTDPEATNTFGQVLALLIIVAWCTLWVLIAARRQRVRDRTRLRRIQRVSGVRPTVGHTTEDRSGK